MSKNQFHEIREQGIDIDCSGMLYQEEQFNAIKPPVLDVTVTNHGSLHRAKLDGEDISKEELLKIINVKHQGNFTLEFHLNNFQRNYPKKYIIKFWEKDIS